MSLSGKEESFCLAVASGDDWETAASKAGYANPATAAEGLRQGPRSKAIQARIAELATSMGEKPPGLITPEELSVEPSDMDRDWTLRQLRDVYFEARQFRQLRAAIVALELVGRENFMFTQRKEFTFPSIKEMTTSQIRQQLLELKETEFEVVDAASADESDA
jgi:hypothetical protein